MATQFTVKLDDKPGEIGRLASALGDRGINIRSLAGDTVGKQNVINFLTSDDAATRRALKDAKFAFNEHEVLIARLPNRPGALGQLAKNLGAAKVNIQTVVPIPPEGGTTDFAIGVDHLAKAKDIVK